MNEFLIGLQFLTRISIVKQTVWTEEGFGRSVKYFPLIGAVLSICYVGIALLIDEKFIMLRSAVILTAMAMLTGGIHCDGFMDTFDGLFSGRDKYKILEIMKDSRVGSFGVVSFVMLMLIEFATLNELSTKFIFTIYSAPIIARLMMVITIGKFNYAREEGMGKAFAKYTDNSTITFAVIETLILIAPLMLIEIELMKNLLIAIFIPLTFTIYFGKLSTKKIGGVTGDIYGAVTLISEMLVMISFLI